MRVVILGAGRLGGLLIESLIGSGREVAVVERDLRVLERLEKIAGVEALSGDLFDEPTLTAAFAMVKAIETRQPGARIELLVTGHDEARAHGAYLRVRAAAERFLGRDVGFAGAFTDLDTASASSDESDDLELTLRRATRANRTARMWAARLLAECSEGAWPEAAHSMN